MENQIWMQNSCIFN